jgi:hypothetical protein
MMMIQSGRVMSNQTLVQSSLAAGPHHDADYDAVYAELTATERGRRFLAEYANRNRCADTSMVIAAISRVEAAIQCGAVPQASIELAGLEPSRTELSRELTAAAATIEPARVTTGERDEDAADASTRVASPSDGILDTEARKDKDYSDAVAMIAVSLTALGGHAAADAAREPERELDGLQHGDLQPAGLQRIFGDSAVPQADAAKTAAPREPAPQDNGPRWCIEAPDFVFGNGREARISDAELSFAAAAARPEFSSTQFLPELGDDDQADLQADPRPDSFEAPLRVVAAESGPASPVTMPMDAATPDRVPDISAPLDVGPPAEPSRPQLRIANSAVPTHQRIARSNSLSVSDALSEEEVIALFG